MGVRNDSVRDVLLTAKDNNMLIRELIRRQLVHELIFDQPLDTGSMERQMMLSGIAVPPDTVMIIQVEAAHKAAGSGSLYRQCREAVFQRLERMLQNDQEALVTIWGSGNLLLDRVTAQDIALLLPIASASRMDEVAATCRQYARYMKAFLEHDGDVTVAIGIGSTVPDWQGLPQSYAEARTALVHKFYLQPGAVIHIADVPDYHRKDVHQLFIRYEALLLDGLRKGDREAFFYSSRRMFEELYGTPQVPPDVLKVRILELLTLLSRASIEMGADPVRLLDLKVRLGNELQEISAAAALRDWLQEVLQEIVRAAAETRRDTATSAVLQAKQYIYMNYARNISLDELAQFVLLSPFYLSHAFTEITGITITEYLTKTRVNKAQTLLMNTNWTVGKIAVSVGYSDPNYFTRVFKRVTGRSPHQYRRGE